MKKGEWEDYLKLMKLYYYYINGALRVTGGDPEEGEKRRRWRSEEK